MELGRHEILAAIGEAAWMPHHSEVGLNMG